MKKGILGYKKDPKNQILFSFSAREGEEWPSDDSDSDFEPTEKEVEEFGLKVTKNKRKKKDQKSESGQKIRKLTTSNKHETNGVSSSGTGAVRCCALPTEIWLKIFQCYVSMYGALPFLCRASKVCRLWYEVSIDPCLWKTIDLSYGWIKSTDRSLSWLCNNRLSQCQDINLTNWKDLSANGVKTLSEKCPHLKSINLSGCKKIGPESVICLADNCKNLCSIDLSFTNVPVSSIKHVVQKCSSRLTHLNVAGNKVVGFNTVLNALLMCPKIELLDFSNLTLTTEYITFNIEKIQAACPKLKVLRLTNSKFRAPDVSRNVQDTSPGFPELEELSLGNSRDKTGFQGRLCFNNAFLQRVLKTSYNLKLLDLRGNGDVTALCIFNTPACNIESLFMAQNAADGVTHLAELLQKYATSLIELDLSWTVYKDLMLSNALDKLVNSQPGAGSNLRSLDLSGTSVTAGSVKKVVEKCENLQYINLSSCRGLPRGMKREYKKSDWKILLKEINNI